MRSDIIIDLRPRIDEAVKFIRRSSALEPEVGLVLGTGLDHLAEEVQVETIIPFGDIPHFPQVTGKLHAGELLLGKLAGRRVAVMKGRVHCYEGYSMQEVTFPIRVLRGLGAPRMIVSSAVGSMNPFMRPGDIVLVADHINLMGDNPLIGPNDDALGDRFPDMSEPYNRRLTDLAEEVALEASIQVHRGVYVALLGPCLETAAEYRMLRALGADVVGMSIVPETIVAVHGRMQVLGISVVTDQCLPDALKPAVVAEIVRVANEAAPRLSKLVKGVLTRLEEV